jgi:murein DD-endopeptidase MepM/ murein hydrolase activator NlpD
MVPKVKINVMHSYIDRMIKFIKSLLSYKVKLFAVVSIIAGTIVVIVCSGLFVGQYLVDAKYQAEKQAWRAEISELEAKNKDYKEQYQEVIAIKDRFRVSIKEIVEMLYNKDSHLATGGSSISVEDTDESVLLQIRNTVQTMQDDQNLLAEVKHYLVARKEFIDNFPFAWPISKTGVPKITSGFGFRQDLKGKPTLHMHAGIDIGGKRGDFVYAPAAGVIIATDYYHELYGKLIIIKHKYDFVTYYAHLDKISVKIGQTVERGQKIGEMGNTGESEGYHLHYEVRRSAVPIDPMTFLNINY